MKTLIATAILGLARAGATRAIGAAARLPLRLLQRLPSAGLVPHRRVV